MHRVAQFFGHLTARVSRDDEALARSLLPSAAWPLFAAMPVADRRHGLDVAGRLLRDGRNDPDLLVAALLHDAGKGHRMRVWHRVGGVLLEATSPSLLRRLASAEPASWGYPYYVYLHHARMSADAALAAGCSARAAGFIRGEVPEADAQLAAALHTADEAS